MATVAALVVVIVRPAPALAPADAARRAAWGENPVWISSPGESVGSEPDVRVAVDVVASDPVNVVGGTSLHQVERAWVSVRAAWSAIGTMPGPEIPVGIGWLSYDLARQWISIGTHARDDGDWPPLEFRFYDAIWMRVVGQPHARILACSEAAAARLAEKMERVPPTRAPPRLGPLRASRISPEARRIHARAVARIKAYLQAGDAYQVNLARRLTAPIGMDDGGDPVWMAATLRERAPAPHAIWIGGRSRPGGPIDRGIVGNSPERFLRLWPDGVVETRPIKGTRPRGVDLAADRAAQAELVAAAKDRAEHVMIVDLERNDLGRVCQTGSVRVDDLLRVLRLPTVFHLVSTVRGRLRADVDLHQLLEATFPGGSVTGAPKRRAMEIIEELEPVRRGIYTGATGWLGAAGDLDLAIAIRTAMVAAGHVSLSVGGGIVADSDADSEFDETEVKARAFMDLYQPDL